MERLKTVDRLTDKLFELGLKADELNGHGKSFEPRLTLYKHKHYNGDVEYGVNFYNYSLELDNGGRNHTFESESIIGLSNKIRLWIKLAEKEIEEMGENGV